MLMQFLDFVYRIHQFSLFGPSFDFIKVLMTLLICHVTSFTLMTSLHFMPLKSMKPIHLSNKGTADANSAICDVTLHKKNLTSHSWIRSV